MGSRDDQNQIKNNFEDIDRRLQIIRDLEGESISIRKQLADRQREIKMELLQGGTVRSESSTAALKLLPERNPSSNNPDDYELIVSYVS